MRTFVYLGGSFVDVSSKDCSLLFDDLIDQIECEEQKRNF